MSHNKKHRKKQKHSMWWTCCWTHLITVQTGSKDWEYMTEKSFGLLDTSFVFYGHWCSGWKWWWSWLLVQWWRWWWQFQYCEWCHLSRFTSNWILVLVRLCLLNETWNIRINLMMLLQFSLCLDSKSMWLVSLHFIQLFRDKDVCVCVWEGFLFHMTLFWLVACHV